MNHLHRVVWFIALTMMVCSPVMAQNPYTVETRPSRGFMPSADQLSSPVDSIEPVSGKLHTEIPLASLPRGRANSGFDLNLVYDSHLYDLDAERTENPEPNWLYPESVYGLYQIGYNLMAQGNTGGWHYNIDNLKFDGELNVGGTPGTPENPCPSDAPGLNYRLRVGLFDGSLHTMILKEWQPGNHLDLVQQGWAGLSPLEGRATPCAQQLGYPAYYTGWLTYYSVDGSYLKLETYVNTNFSWSNPFYLYLPDGRVLAGHGSRFDTLYDANGNAIHFINGCYDEACNQLYTAITDDAGHEMRINRNAGNAPLGGYFGDSFDTITAQGPGGTMTTTVNFEILQLGYNNDRVYRFSNAPWQQTKPFYAALRVVKYIQLPMEAAVPSSQAPDVWNSYAFTYNGDPDGWGEVHSMRTPSGMQVQYEWSGNGPSAISATPGGVVVQRTITHDGISDLVWTYGYLWDKTTITNPDGSQSLYWHGPFGDYLDSSIADNFGVGDVVYRIDEPNGRVQKRVWSQNRTTLVAISGMQGIQNVWVRRETTTIGNASGTPSLTAVTDRTIDKNGNLLQTTEYDWVSYNSSGPETGSVAKRVTQYTYHASVPNYDAIIDSPYAYWNPPFYPLTIGSARRLDAVRRKEVSDGSGNKAAITETYDDDPFRAGNVTWELHWDSVKSASPPGLGALSASNSQVLNRSYDGYGNVTEFYEPEIRTHITYDGTGSVPIRVDYAYQTAQQRSWGYDWNITAGTLNSKTDLDNNVTTTYTYDAVGRLKITDEANLRITESNYDDPNLMVTVMKDLNTHGDRKLQVTTQYDQLGRAVLARSTEPGNADGIKVKSAYYPLSNRSVHSSPYRTLSDATLEWTCTQSDTSKRVTAVAIFKGSEPTDCESTANRTGITRNYYDTSWTVVTDPAGAVTADNRDGLGRLIYVAEDPSTLNYPTFYQYDTLNNLTNVWQPDGAITQSRTFNYSSLGRLLTASNPESGTLNYSYSDSGDLLTRTDDRGIVTTNTYDAMHRVVTRSYSGDGGVTPNVTYVYYPASAASGNVGQLQSMNSSASTVIYGYDVLGRTSSTNQTTNGNGYAFQYTYRLNDSLSSMQYPFGKTVNFDADDAARVNKVSTTSKTYTDLTASSAPFTADGRIAQMKLGNDLWESRVFQTPGSPTLLKLGTSVGANDKLEIEYDYSATANNGNLATQVIRQPGHTWTQNYTYDSINRIATAAETNGFSRTYGYDRFGNRWVAASSGITAADSHEPTVGTLFNKANNRLANQGYDAAGNQTSYDPRTLTYDAENRMISATSPQNGNEYYLYDGDGRRVRKTWTPNGGSTQITTYVYGPGGQLAAEYSNQIAASTGTSWMFADLLGSVRAVTGEKPQSGTAPMTECYDYLPFGRMLSSSDNGRNTGCYPSNPDFALSSVESKKFTGKERDETGLDYFGARYFSGAQGRFTSADKPFADQHAADPQSWNLYSYVRNNPVKNTDPTGRDCIDGVRSCANVLLGALGQMANSVYGVFNLPNRAANVLISPFTSFRFDDIAPTFKPENSDQRLGMARAGVAGAIAPITEMGAATELASTESRSLSKLASEIRESGVHPAARNMRVIAVGEDAEGNLFAGSSNGFDRGQKAAAEARGIDCVSCKSGAHAEENLMREIPELKKVGTSKQMPCGPGKHDCAGQLNSLGVEVEKH